MTTPPPAAAAADGLSEPPPFLAGAAAVTAPFEAVLAAGDLVVAGVSSQPATKLELLWKWTRITEKRITFIILLVYFFFFGNKSLEKKPY